MDKTGRDASPMICLSFYIYSYQVYEFCNTVFLELTRIRDLFVVEYFSKKYHVEI
jgi:hypothetical protein